MIKEITLNNKIFYHLINEKDLKDIYISKIDFYNLIINPDITIIIKKAIPENNEKNYKPRNEVIARLIKNKNKIKIGIGKNYKPIESKEDIQDEFIIDLDPAEFEIYTNFIKIDFEKYENYENIKKLLKQKNATNKKIKNINF